MHFAFKYLSCSSVYCSSYSNINCPYVADRKTITLQDARLFCFYHLHIPIDDREEVIWPILSALLTSTFHQVGHHHYCPENSGWWRESEQLTYFAAVSQVMRQKSSLVEKSGPWVFDQDRQKKGLSHSSPDRKHHQFSLTHSHRLLEMYILPII